ncbi:NAD(P)H-binding [Paenibacillus uliginis N3/975]|uniref:NAD(P)H-binding n=1 Tax=Paenibacillus uliginis N3/975 TaxID=1313296 RepID=A0A1X7HQE1_9BACL|nr:NAD(P)H-binding protein [Paenibacillus uliginis]SMF91080.1 NAD(P)H-binding [Paenibacillus uliginis N3/975]
MGMTSLVMGATGLVGRHVTEELLSREGIDEVRLLVRRPPDIVHPKLTVIQTDWDKLEQYEDAFTGVHSVFSCLGTTIKKAGSQKQFRKVDLEYVLAGAKLAKGAQVGQFLAVSSVGADPKARTFYSRVKGEMEEELCRLRFQGLHLFRPSLLLGNRDESRLGEGVASVLMTKLDFAFKGRLAPYRAVPAVKVAKSMVNISMTDTRGNHIYPNEVIHVLGE